MTQGTKNNPGKFDCYAKAHPDEPMFVLLGRDRHAPTLVWLWAVLRELDQEPAEVVAEARNCLISMLAWQHAHDRKVTGLGQAALAGVMELIRAVNTAVASSNGPLPGDATTVDLMRVFMARTRFEGPDDV